MQYLTKTFYFCAAHRYGHKDWSDAKNTEVFGVDAKNHGHNYTLEVTVKGSINPETGFIVDLGKLKKIVKNNILDSMDHSQIDNDIPWFKDKKRRYSLLTKEKLKKAIPKSLNNCVRNYDRKKP